MDKTHLKDHKQPARAGGSAPPHLPLIGAQISTAGGFGPVPQRAMAIGAEVVQIFGSNPRTWHTQPLDPQNLAALATNLERHSLPLFFHSVYLINLASPDDDLRWRSSAALAHALALGTLAGAAGVVTHVGSHRGEGFEKAVTRVTAAALGAVDSAVATLAEVGHAPGPRSARPLPSLLLETGAGAGATVGGRLEELAVLVTALALELHSTGPTRPAIGVCLDSAHLFAAGYAVHEPGGLSSLVRELESLELLDKVGLVHLNDSATPFSSNRDRHENPGDGQMGYDGLAGVVRHPALALIPFVLEVPGADGHGPDAANIALVKAMRAGVPCPPRVPAHGAANPEGAG